MFNYLCGNVFLSTRCELYYDWTMDWTHCGCEPVASSRSSPLKALGMPAFKRLDLDVHLPVND